MAPDLTLLGGTVAILVALSLLLFVTLRPRYQDIAVTRRRPTTNAEIEASVITRMADATVATVERGVGQRRRGLFGKDALQEAGLAIKPSEFLVLIFTGCFVLGICGFLVGGIFLCVLFAALSPVLAWLFLSTRSGKRRRRFSEQLTDMLRAISGSLRSGHSITQSMHSASLEMPAPMSEELARIVNENRVGRPVSDAMAEVGRRMKCEDFEWLSQAIEINREVGGDLAGVLDHAAETVRERSQIKGQVRALAAEGKFSAFILIGLPFVVAIFINVVNPGYMATLFQSLLGWIFIIVGVIMMAIGSFWISRMVKIEF
ncbi:type II secretion system F family protein [Pseudarthrobacter sp. PvP004]|uniref:type II secretion system F family protein n=1 Tax=Pseudarthrobacter sp. PvP004 TaxID=2817850 RepID=UPI002572B240|nr:type II secretion system F family protein [Pseudarthrobacter sp. PvP004]